ncbi:MAG: phage protein GemA/Gp16 family protein [Bilophila wadsworthia]
MIIDFATAGEKPAPPETATPVSARNRKAHAREAQAREPSRGEPPRGLAKIHVAKKQLAMDDETYRTMLMSQFGVESARDLSAHQRKSCILYMQRLGFEGKRGKASPQRTGERRKRRDVPLTLEKDDSGLGRDVYMRKIEAQLAEKGRAEGTKVPWGYAVAYFKKAVRGRNEVFRARDGRAAPGRHRRINL